MLRHNFSWARQQEVLASSAMFALFSASCLRCCSLRVGSSRRQRRQHERLIGTGGGSGGGAAVVFSPPPPRPAPWLSPTRQQPALAYPVNPESSASFSSGCAPSIFSPLMIHVGNPSTLAASHEGLICACGGRGKEGSELATGSAGRGESSASPLRRSCAAGQATRSRRCPRSERRQEMQRPQKQSFAPSRPCGTRPGSTRRTGSSPRPRRAPSAPGSGCARVGGLERVRHRRKHANGASGSVSDSAGGESLVDYHRPGDSRTVARAKKK